MRRQYFGYYTEKKLISHIAEAATNGKEDYLMEDIVGENIHIGGVQLQGRRAEQQDRMIASMLENENKAFYRSLNSHEVDSVFTETFEEINEKMLKDFPEQGSTALIALIDLEKNQVKLVNIGDSEFIAVRRDLDEKWTATTCNTLHRPKHRLNGELGVSRALGDKKYIEHGLIATPEIEFFSYSNLIKKEKIYFIIACDGLKEGGLCNNEIAHRVGLYDHHHHHQSLKKLAKTLSQSAYMSSTDNISIQIAACSKESKGIILFGMFDGHCGKDISDYLKMHFEKIFFAKLKSKAERMTQMSELASGEKSQSLLPGFLKFSEKGKEEEITIAPLDREKPNYMGLS